VSTQTTPRTRPGSLRAASTAGGVLSGLTLRPATFVEMTEEQYEGCVRALARLMAGGHGFASGERPQRGRSGRQR